MAVIFARTPRVAVFLALVVAASLSACAPAPQPSPTPTPAFASEEEAFAAAEAVYRAYNEAGNARIAGKASPDPQDFLIGEALEADLTTLRSFGSQGIHLEGTAAVERVVGDSLVAETVVAAVCINAADIRVISNAGADVTPHDRPERSLLMVSFVMVASDLKIFDSQLASETEC